MLVPLLPMQTGLVVAILVGMLYGAWRDRPAAERGDLVSAQAQFWVLIVALALGTWLMRSLPIMLHGHVPHPPWLERFLKHVPVAALTALVVPGARSTCTPAAPTRSRRRASSPRVLALFVALRTKNVLATLVVGMAVLWLGQWALSALG